MKITTLMVVALFVLVSACSDDTSGPGPDTFRSDSFVISDLPVSQHDSFVSHDGPVTFQDGSVIVQDGPVVFQDSGMPRDHGTSDWSPDTTPYPDLGTGPATCGTSDVLLVEVAVGQPDYLVLKNTGSSPVDIGGYLLVMTGITPTFPDKYLFAAGTTIAANGRLYVFEYASSSVAGDINTGDNIPFYDNSSSNSVALYDSSLKLVDFVAIGDLVINAPAGVNTTTVPWPTNWNDGTQSFQRGAYQGSCPNFLASDWGVGAITRP